MTRNSRRVLLLTGIFGLSLLSCGREVTGPGDGFPFGLSRVAALAIDPQFPRLPGTNFASDIVPFVQVRVTLRGLDGAVVKDTVVDFPSDADSVALALDVPLPFTVSDSGVSLTLAMAFVNAAGDTVFRGGPAAIRARPSGATANVPIVIPVAWVPPGAVPASVVMTPTTGTVVAGTTTLFSATAFDGGGAPIPGTPIDFSADTASRASFAAPGSGTVTWLPSRGNVRIIASTLNLRADTSFFVVSLPASRLLAVSGGAQSAVIGTALTQPLVFRVTASDSVPVAGIPVTFAVTTGGGTLVALADTSDAAGLVSTSWTLGSVVGAQSVTATATGIAGATQVVTATGLAPLPTQLAITAAPISGVAGATLAPVTVEVRDANDVVTTLFTGPVTLALNAGATGATLSGTATVNAVAGIATFADLSIQRAAVGLTFSATSGALTPDTSAAFAIASAAPASITVIAGNAQTGTLGLPLTDSITVEVRDAFANAVAGATVTFATVTAGASISPTSVLSDANGQAKARWVLGPFAGAQTARADVTGGFSANLTATGVAGAAARLQLFGQPLSLQVAGAPIADPIVFRVIDAVGATVTTFSDSITIVLAESPAGPTTPTGTLTALAVDGLVTFNNVAITLAGTGFRFTASSGALPADTTSGITVLNAAAAQLTTVSGNAQSGAVITALAAPFVVRVTDSFGNGVSGFAVDWAITSAGGALSATTTATNAGGFASTTLTLPSVAGAATVQATAGGLTGSPQLFTATATAGTASQLAFTLNTGGGIAGTPITPGWVIQARDGLGNVVPSFTGAVTVALTNGPPTAVLGGTTTVNAVAGVATFADLTVDLGASSWVLAATSPGLAGANSAAFSIGAAAPTQIAVLSGDAQTAAVVASLSDSIAFRVTDQFGNFATGAPVTVAMTVGDGSVSPVGGVTDANGRFATAWTLGTLLGAQSITATITTAPTAQAVATATATPGAAVALELVSAIGSQVAGDTIPPIVVQALDAIGNVATGFNGVVNGRVLTGPEGPDVDSVSVTAVNGVATFTGASFDVAGDYTLRFNAVGLTDFVTLPFTVTAGPASRLTMTNGNGQTGTAGLPLAQGLQVRTEDFFGNAVAGIAVDWVLLRGVDTLAVQATTSDAAGLATYFPSMPTTPGPVQIIATSAGLLNSPMSFNATVIADVAAVLEIVTPPSAGTVSVALPASSVRALDQYGNVQGGFSATVAVAIDSGPPGATLSGNTSVSPVVGVATFANIGVSLVGSYRLRYTSVGMTDAVSTPFVVSAGAATQLVISQQTASGTAGATLTPGWIVEARDGAGNLATSFTGAVTVALSGGDVNAVLGGTVTVNAALGVANFTDLSVDLVGTTYTLTATAGGVTDATSGTFSIAPAAPANIAVVAGDSQSGVVSTTLTDSVAFRVTDAFGNRVPATLVGVAVTTGGGALAPLSGNTDANGELRTAWTLGAPLGAQSITATIAAAPAVQVVATATAIAGAATQLVITSTPLGPQVAGVAFPDVVVEARDAAGNLATAFNGTVGAYVLDTAAVPFDSAAAVAAGGVATFSGAFLEAAGTYSLRFFAPGLTDALSSAFVVTPAAAAILGPDGANSGDGQAAPILTTLANPLRARLTDTYLNPIAGVTVLFTGTRGIDTLSVDTLVTNAQGIASITPSMPETAGPIQYLVSGTGLTGFTFNITADVGAAASLTISASPTGGSVDAPIGTTSLTARDLGGNAVLAFTGNVTVTIDSGTVGALMAGTLTQAAVAGVATFADLRLDRPGDYRLRFTSAGLSDEITTLFTMTVGAPAALTVLEGNGQTGGALQVLPDSIGARVADMFGNPIAGATVVWTVQAGGGSLAFASGSTDAAGIARNAWTLGANIGTQSVSADAAGLTQVTFTATATATLANITWTGATSANWSVASNWSGGVVPTVSDSVRIPAGTPFAATLDAQAFVVGRLLVENGATVVLDTFPLFVNGTLDVEAGAAVLSDSLGGFALIGNGAVRGAMPRLYVQNGAHTLNGPLALAGDLSISGGSFDAGTFAATVGGVLSTLGTGQLIMTSAPGSITVQGDAIFAGGSTAGTLTAGVLTVRGDFVQAGGAADAFSTSGTHVVDLDGSVTQLVTLLNADTSFTTSCGTGSCFATLRSLKGAGAGAIEFNSNAKATTLMQFTGDSVYAPGQTLIAAGTPDFQTAVTVAGAIGWQVALTRGATFQVDTLIAWGTSQTLIVGETIPTRVLGEYQLVGAHPGAIVVDGATGLLDVAGAVSVGSGAGPALVTRGNGRVRMSQAADTLAVLGDADFGGVTVAGEMTDGLLEIGGDFVMSNETDPAFIASGAHLTRFIGVNPTAAFSVVGGNRFANLEINSASGFTFAGDAAVGGDVVLGPTTSVVGGGLITIGGDLIDAVGTRWQTAQTVFEAVDPVIPPQFTGSVAFLNGVVLDTAMVIGGILEIRGGLLDLNGRRVDVSGQFEANNTGALRMANAADTLVVGGAASFSGASSAGQLNAGYLELQGDFSQLGNAEAFAASGTHQTWFSGIALQTISFANPGSGAGTSHFAALGHGQNVLGVGVVLGTDAFADGMLLVPSLIGGEFVGSGAERLFSFGADVRGATFSSVGWTLLDGGPVIAIDSVSFGGQDPASLQFVISRNGGTIGLVAPAFSAVPTTGRYLSVQDTDGPTANGALTVNITTPTPATNGGFLDVVNGAVVNGWTDFAGLNWTGAVSTDWSTVGNWAENRIPSPTDSVFFGVGVAQMPVLTVQPTVRALVNDNANPVTMTGGNWLFVQQRLVLRPDTDGIVCDGGSVDLTPLSALGVVPAQGRIRCNLTVAQGRVVLSDSLVVADSAVIVQGTARLVPNGRRLRTLGSLFVSGNGSFEMTGATDTVIARNASFTGNSTAGTMTAGELILSGALNSGAGADAFAPSGTHRTTFVSGVVDTANISFADPATATFARLEVQRPVRVQSRARVAADAFLFYGGAVSGPGRLEVAGDFVGTTSTDVTINALEVGGVFADTGSYRADTTVFTGTGQVLPFRVGAATIPQFRTVRVTGDATAGITGGLDSLSADLIVEGTLRFDDVTTPANVAIARDLIVRGGGRLLSANQPHSFLVYRHAEFAGADADGDLAVGAMFVRGDFTQLSTTSARSFRPALPFETHLDSIGTISFADPVESRFGRLAFSWSGGVRTMLTAVNAAGVLDLSADGGATVESDVLVSGGTRQLTANGVSQGGTMQFRNVALRLQGDLEANFTTTMSFSDFDPLAVQFEIARDSGAIIIYDPAFSTTPVSGGRYLRVVDTNTGDALPLTVDVNGVPTPQFHGGFAEAVAPAVLNGWLANPNFTWSGGGTTSDWNTPANWAGGSLPGAADSVFVPGGLLYNPVIPAGITLRAFVSARTDSPIGAAGSFTITERLQVPTQGGLACPVGSVNFSNAVTPMTASGYMSCFLRVLDGTLTATDTLDVGENDIQVEGTAILDAGSALLAVSGQFSTLTGGRLRMQDDSTHVRLSSGASFGGGSTAGLLTAGLLEIGGNFTQNNDAESFSASGTHVTLFSGTATQGAQFANPGANAGFSHFANLAIGQPAGATSVDLATDAFAIGQLRAGTDPQRLFTSSTGQVLTTHGADITAVAFDNVPWRLRDGAPVGTIGAVSFANMDPSVIQFDAERGTGTVAVSDMSFTSVPSGGAYLRVADVDGATGGNFTLSMSNTSPSSHGGLVVLANGGVLLGWPEFPAAQAIQWTGSGGNSLWNTLANWDLGRLPIATDSVVIDGSVAAGAGNPYSVDVNVSTTVAKLIVGPSATLTLNHTFGQTLTVDSLSSMPSNVTLNLTNGSTLAGAGDVNFGGFLNWNGGTIAGAGIMNVQGGGTADIASTASVTLNGRTLSIGGIANIGGFDLNEANSPTLATQVGGELTFAAPKSLFLGSTPSIVNAGTLRISPAGNTVRIDWPISNTGTLEVASGVLDLRNTLTHSSGAISILANATLVNGGNTVASAAIAIADFGTLTLQSGGISADAGNHIFGSTSSISGLGAMRINSADTVRIQGAMDLDSLTVQNGNTWFESASDTMFVTNGAYLGGGFVRGTGILAIRGAFSTSTGNMNGTGTIAVRPTGTFTLQSPLRGWTVDVAGTLVWGDYDLSFEVEPVSGVFANVNIRTGGVFDIQHAATNRELFATGFNPLPNNELILDIGAIVRKSSGSAISNLRPRVFHSGVFDVLSGTVNVQGLCSVTGGTKTGAGSLTGNCGNFP